MAQALRNRYPFLAPELRIDNLVIGAGCMFVDVWHQDFSARAELCFLAEAYRSLVL